MRDMPCTGTPRRKVSEYKSLNQVAGVRTSNVPRKYYARNCSQRVVFLGLALLLFVSPGPLSLISAQPESASNVSAPKQIDLFAGGYQQQSAMERRSGKVNLTVDFLDDDHVLFTFNPRKLVRRLPECPPWHEDHLIHAAVLEISTGHTQRQADWYVHDARRYLWKLGSGQFLFRNLNTLYRMDSGLHTSLLQTFSDNLLWVFVTPDGKQIIVETPDTKSDDRAAAKTSSKTPVRIEFLDSDSLKVQRVIKSEKPVNVEAVSTGFSSVVPSFTGKVWLIRFGPDNSNRANIARVRTQRTPDVLYPSTNTMLIGRDSSHGPGYSVSAFTLTGNRLWGERWPQYRYAPAIQRSEVGSRFAISTLRVLDSTNPDATDSQSSDEGVEQQIQVFDTATGTPVFSTIATPVSLTGDNFALSPDANRLAVVHGTSLDVHDLPHLSPEEEAKYTAVKADVPGLYIPPAGTSNTEAEREPLYTSLANGIPPARQEPDKDSKLSPATPDASQPAALSTESSRDSHPVPPSDTTATLPNVTFKSSARVVAVDVVVTDSKGGLVRGLQKQDFQIREDGKSQTVSYFDEVHVPDSNSAPSATAGANQQPQTNIFSNQSPVADTGLTIILYDLLNTPAPDQQRAKVELIKFLQNKPKGARFALCTLASTLQMIQGFTPDEGLLVRAARAQKGSLGRTSLLSQDDVDRQTILWLQQSAGRELGRRNTAGSNAMLDTAGHFQQQETARQSRDIETRMQITMDAFMQLARYLAAIPGRKSLVWVAGSFPLGIFPGMDFKNPYSESSGFVDEAKEAANLLAESHIAVYPVDVRGLTAPSMELALSQASSIAAPTPPLSVTQRFDQLAALGEAGGIGANLPNAGSPFAQEMTEHGIMKQIAADTGGQAFYNNNGLEQAMSTVMEHEENYYALSYVSSNKKYDGKFRKIQVVLGGNRKNVRVIHRSGYFAVDPLVPQNPARDVSSGFGLAAMQYGAPSSRQISFEVRVVPMGKARLVNAALVTKPSVKKKRRKVQDSPEAGPVEMQRYAIDYAITPSQLHFDATPSGLYHEMMNFMVASFTEDGRAQTSNVSRSTGDLSPQGYQEVMTGGVRLHQEVEVPVKAAALRVGVQDGITGGMGTIEIQLPVKAPPGIEHAWSERMPPIEPD